MARPTKEKEHIFDLRRELIWFLDTQGYDGPELGVIFGIDKSGVARVIQLRPQGWKSKWRVVGRKLASK